MTTALIGARFFVSAALVVFMVLSFLPRFAAERLVQLQNFLTETIDRRLANEGR